MQPCDERRIGGLDRELAIQRALAEAAELLRRPTVGLPLADQLSLAEALVESEAWRKELESGRGRRERADAPSLETLVRSKRFKRALGDLLGKKEGRRALALLGFLSLLAPCRCRCCCCMGCCLGTPLGGDAAAVPEEDREGRRRDAAART